MAMAMGQHPKMRTIAWRSIRASVDVWESYKVIRYGEWPGRWMRRVAECFVAFACVYTISSKTLRSDDNNILICMVLVMLGNQPTDQHKMDLSHPTRKQWQPTRWCECVYCASVRTYTTYICIYTYLNGHAYIISGRLPCLPCVYSVYLYSYNDWVLSGVYLLPLASIWPDIIFLWPENYLMTLLPLF